MCVLDVENRGSAKDADALLKKKRRKNAQELELGMDRTGQDRVGLGERLGPANARGDGRRTQNTNLRWYPYIPRYIEYSTLRWNSSNIVHWTDQTCNFPDDHVPMQTTLHGWILTRLSSLANRC